MKFIKLALCSLAIFFANTNAADSVLLQSGVFGENGFPEAKESTESKAPKLKDMSKKEARKARAAKRFMQRRRHNELRKKR